MTTQDRERLAAEYVFGTLEGADADRAEQLAAKDADFAAEVGRWRDQMSELDETAPLIPPADALWARIEQSIDASSAAGARAETPRTAAPARAPVSTRSDGSGLWRSLAFWRLAGMAGAFATLALAVGLAHMAQLAARGPVLVAVLLTEGSTEPAAVVNAFADGRTELVPLRTIEVPAGKALEVWTLWDRAVGPRSIGLIDRARTISLDLSKLPTPGPDQLFEITLEPKSGSPTGRPTGPILMKGLTSRAL